MAPPPSGLVFEVVQHRSGRFSAQCLNARIGTEGPDWQGLHDNLTAAVADHYGDIDPPAAEEIHLLVYQE